jgi:hypothetical protein
VKSNNIISSLSILLCTSPVVLAQDQLHLVDLFPSTRFVESYGERIDESNIFNSYQNILDSAVAIYSYDTLKESPRASVIVQCDSNYLVVAIKDMSGTSMDGIPDSIPCEWITVSASRAPIQHYQNSNYWGTNTLPNTAGSSGDLNLQAECGQDNMARSLWNEFLLVETECQDSDIKVMSSKRWSTLGWSTARITEAMGNTLWELGLFEGHQVTLNKVLIESNLNARVEG